MADRLLLRGGTVLTVDPDLGDLPKGDVLIEGDTIAQVAPQIDADAEVVDASGMIVIPGFVDTHRHTWEAAIPSPASSPSTDTLSRLTMSNSLPTDGWALPVSIWERALALIPRRLAVSRSERPWRRRSARRLAPRSSTLMAGVYSGHCSASLHTRYAPADIRWLFVEEEYPWPTGSCCVAAPS